MAQRDIDFITQTLSRRGYPKERLQRAIKGLDPSQPDRSESPIEYSMFLTLFSAFAPAGNGPLAPLGDGYSFGQADEFGGREIRLRQQINIGPHRTDFLIEIGNALRICVECDGHEYHARTKEQAARDRSRDRWLQTAGYMVLRFTGSEIWRDPADCAIQVYDAAIAASRRVS